MTSAAIADGLVDALRHAGVERVYGVPYNGLKLIVDAIARTDEIAWTEVRDDQTGVLAAASEAQATGALAVCAGTYGGGRSPLVRGLRDAHRCGEPLLALAARMATTDTAAGLPHEIHPERLFIECSDYCGVVTDASQLPQLARSAIQHALVRQGVSVLLLDLPTITPYPGDQFAPCASRQSVIRRPHQVARSRGLPLHLASAVNVRRGQHS